MYPLAQPARRPLRVRSHGRLVTLLRAAVSCCTRLQAQDAGHVTKRPALHRSASMGPLTSALVIPARAAAAGALHPRPSGLAQRPVVSSAIAHTAQHTASTPGPPLAVTSRPAVPVARPDTSSRALNLSTAMYLLARDPGVGLPDYVKGIRAARLAWFSSVVSAVLAGLP